MRAEIYIPDLSCENIYFAFQPQVHKCHIFNITELSENNNNNAKKGKGTELFLSTSQNNRSRFQVIGIEFSPWF